MMTKVCRYIFSAAILILLLPANLAAREVLKTGDLIFQDLDCGELCDAIENVTKIQFHVDGPSLSHVGMIFKKNDQTFVIEAYGSRVVMTPIQEVLGRPQNSPSKIIHLKDVRGLSKHFSLRLAKAAQRYVGRFYDDHFDISDETYYCSELIYKIFQDANNGKEFFHLLPMMFGAPNSQERDVWKKYFGDLKTTIPEGRPGISPLGIWLQLHERRK